MRSHVTATTVQFYTTLVCCSLNYFVHRMFKCMVKWHTHTVCTHISKDVVCTVLTVEQCQEGNHEANELTRAGLMWKITGVYGCWLCVSALDKTLISTSCSWTKTIVFCCRLLNSCWSCHLCSRTSSCPRYRCDSSSHCAFVNLARLPWWL